MSDNFMCAILFQILLDKTKSTRGMNILICAWIDSCWDLARCT